MSSVKMEDRKMGYYFIADAISRVLFKEISMDYNDSDSDDDQEFFLYLQKKRKISRIRPVRITNFVEDIVPSYTGKQFQIHFRMVPNAFQALLCKIGNKLKNTGLGRKNIDPEKQLLSVLWLLATPDSFRSVGNRFNLGKSSLWDCFNRIIQILNDMCTEIIHWPNMEEMEIISKKFRKISKVNLENCIGAIDGCYIPIKAPQMDAEIYITRKCNYAITLQAICDANLKYIDCYAGYPGSVSDRRIFKNSDIYNKITLNTNIYVPNNKYIVGDKAYPVLSWCITPYIDRGTLTAIEKKFNIIISRVRQTIEISFALLKGRFRRLKFLDMGRTDLIPMTIMACCVLHNICLDYESSLLQNEYVQEGVNIDLQEHDNRVANEIFDEDELTRDQLMMSLNYDSDSENEFE